MPNGSGKKSKVAILCEPDKIDEAKKRIIIEDNGIGMSRDEVISNLGTIARSGTSEFLKSLTGDQQKDSQLIGQFGVGFYSSFIVAKKVIVETRRAGNDSAEGVRWTCKGEADYKIETIGKADRGTKIELHLKKDAQEFANSWRLRNVIKKYSDHISIPVQMLKQEPPPTDENKDETVISEPEWSAINDAQALWTKPRNKIKDEEYKEFYRHVSSDFTDPLSWSHNKVEGKQDLSLIHI